MELRHLPDYSQIAGRAEIYADMDAESLKTFLTLFDMSKKMNQVMEHYFSSHGLSEGKFKILMFLFDAPGHSLSPTELAKIQCHQSDHHRIDRRTRTGRLCKPQPAYRRQTKNQHRTHKRRKRKADAVSSRPLLQHFRSHGKLHR